MCYRKYVLENMFQKYFEKNSPKVIFKGVKQSSSKMMG